jgi:hypothetical protein
MPAASADWRRTLNPTRPTNHQQGRVNRKPRLSGASLGADDGTRTHDLSAWQIARAESDRRKIRAVELLLGQIGQVRSAYSGTKFGTRIVSCVGNGGHDPAGEGDLPRLRPYLQNGKVAQHRGYGRDPAARQRSLGRTQPMWATDPRSSSRSCRGRRGEEQRSAATMDPVVDVDPDHGCIRAHAGS